MRSADVVSPEDAYGQAPSTVQEISALVNSCLRAGAGPLPRGWWLRKAALLDRIALKETAKFTPDIAAPALRAAEAAAKQLVLYDGQHLTRGGEFSPDALASAAPADGHGHRAYVRQEYLVWSLAEDS